MWGFRAREWFVRAFSPRKRWVCSRQLALFIHSLCTSNIKHHLQFQVPILQLSFTPYWHNPQAQIPNPTTLSPPSRLPRFHSLGSMIRTAIARPPPMDIEDGWRRLAAGFEKLLRILDGEEMLSFSGAEYSELLQYGTLFFSTSFCFFLFSLGFNLTHIDMGRLPRRRITYKLCYESPAGHAAEMYDRWDKTIRHHIVYQVCAAFSGSPCPRDYHQFLFCAPNQCVKYSQLHRSISVNLFPTCLACVWCILQLPLANTCVRERSLLISLCSCLCYLIMQVLPSLQDMQGEPLLKNFVHDWENHKVLMKWLKSVCMYLRLAFTNQRSLPPIMDIGLNLFKNVVRSIFWSLHVYSAVQKISAKPMLPTALGCRFSKS